MKITGEILKSERVSKNLSVQEVALALKLSSKVILALEAGELEALPSKTFVRGFVKSYAQFLKLDSEVVLRQFQEEMGSTNPMPKIPPPQSPSAHEKTIRVPRPSLKKTFQDGSKEDNVVSSVNLNSDNPKKIIQMVSIAVSLVLILVVSNKIIDKFKTNPLAMVEPVPVAVSVNSATPVNPETAASSDTSIAKTAEDTTTTAPPLVTAAGKPNADQLEEGFEKSTGKPVEILIEAKKDTEIFYAKGDSTHFFPLKISANQLHVLRSKVGLYLKTHDSGAIKISVNGLELNHNNSNSKTLKLSF